MEQRFEPIECATLDWQQVDGVDIPVSQQFGDVYFSKANGLLETRHVFLDGNDLTERLSQLKDNQYFIVGETGFGTGLNFLALWQLWAQVRPDNGCHLHFISVEKFPLSLTDLKRALAVWKELLPYSTQLIEHYPLPLAGCHRLHFKDAHLSLDLWLGDAAACFPQMQSQHPVDAWFLDGFAPSCNPEMWHTDIFQHMMRLSAYGTTFSSFSVAGVLKRSLKEYGVDISRPKGFGYKREMLKAIWQSETAPIVAKPQHVKKVAIIGAGIAGLNCAWALAQRGIEVHLFEKDAPLSGGSGNPLALINPKLCPITQTAQHLMTTSWQYALRFYAQFDGFRTLHIDQYPDKNTQQYIEMLANYPKEVITWEQGYGRLHHAGAVDPARFAIQVLAHPLIQLHHIEIDHIDVDTENTNYALQHQGQVIAEFSHLICCNATALNRLIADTPKLKPIRGQVSWANLDNTNLDEKQAYSYGGYAAALHPKQLIFGASFHPQREDIAIEEADHQHNFALLDATRPDLAQQLPPIQTWQGRAALRAQTADYLPLVGKINPSHPHLYCLAGLGSKGFMFAPLCSELIATEILSEMQPMPKILSDCLQAQRFRKKIKVKKPYFKMQ